MSKSKIIIFSVLVVFVIIIGTYYTLKLKGLDSRLSECAVLSNKYYEYDAGIGMRTTNDRNDCITRIAQFEKKDASLCKYITDKKGEEKCLDLTYLEIAGDEKNPNPELCDKISSYSLKKSCVYGAYFNVAKISKNPDDCNNIKDEADQDLCYIGLAYTTGDASLCNRISDQKNLKTRCLSYAEEGKISLEAKDQGDYSICEKIGTEVRRSSCYLEVAKKLKDLKACRVYFEMNQNAALPYEDPYSDINQCYLQLAKEMKDISVCDSAHGDFVNFCKKYVGNQ